MKTIYIIDTGVIVSYLNANDQYHQWSNDILKYLVEGMKAFIEKRKPEWKGN